MGVILLLVLELVIFAIFVKRIRDIKNKEMAGVARTISASYDIRAYEQKLHRLVLDTAPVIIFVIDRLGNLVIVNNSFADLFNATPKEMVGNNLSLYISDAGLLSKMIVDSAKVFDGGTTELGGELYLKNKKTNEWRTFSVSRRVMVNGTTLVVNVGADITTFKATLEAFRVNQNHYSKLVEYNSILILQVSDEMLVTYANKASEKFLGMLQYNCIGLELLDIIAPNDRERLRRSFARWANYATRTDEEFECKIIGRNAQIISIIWNVTIIWHENAFVGLNMSGLDITQRNRERDNYKTLLETYEKAMSGYFDTEEHGNSIAK